VDKQDCDILNSRVMKKIMSTKMSKSQTFYQAKIAPQSQKQTIEPGAARKSPVPPISPNR
jgi:hypothetical protein